MKISFKPYDLKLKYPFTIAGYSRTYTPILLIQIHFEGLIGYGEASMVPYLGESKQTAINFLNKVDISWISFPFNYGEIIEYLDAIDIGNPAIKAAIDIALHDLQGKVENTPCYQFFEANPLKMPITSLTIGIDNHEVIIQKVIEAEHCKVLKAKLGSANDRELIQTIRSASNKPLYVDANQGWKNKEECLEMIYWLNEQGVVLIEQPMLKTDIDSNSWITERSPIPIIADESVQRFEDIEKAKGVYHGINVKLMKSAGMYEAHRMIKKARELNLKVLMGCMSETSCATLAAAALAPLCDWADLDGPFLTSNNPFKDPEFEDGKWKLSEEPGLGVPPAS